MIGRSAIEDGGFAGPHAEETPLGDDHLVDECGFDIVSGRVDLEQALAQGVELGVFFDGQDDSGRGEAMAETVHSRMVVSFVGDGAVGQGAVLAAAVDFA
jgi:hypothetical protein